MEGIFIRNNTEKCYVPLYFKYEGFWYEYCGKKNIAYTSKALPIFVQGGPKCLIKW